ncbi:MAG: hypothetical protein D6695_11880 [Planctomycetota bacterium]|nr:MAG: hypothetical protein D6695_11880 [Planctomycetota bacterium]
MTIHQQIFRVNGIAPVDVLQEHVMKSVWISVLTSVATLGATFMAVQLDTRNDWLAWTVVSVGSAFALWLGSAHSRRQRCCLTSVTRR